MCKEESDERVRKKLCVYVCESVCVRAKRRNSLQELRDLVTTLV